MGNNGSSGSKYHFVCFRCDRIIEPGERMHTLSASIETPTEDGSVGVIESEDISCLCGGCASVLLAEAAIGEKLTVPPAATEATEEEGSKGSNEAVLSSANRCMKPDILISFISEDGRGEGALEAHCSQKGFYLTLHCPDGIGWARSQVFTWKQIAQLLIAADPGMFGRLDEPLHQIFPHTLSKLGYSVPNWDNYVITEVLEQ
jgi:hypothetical protein